MKTMKCYTYEYIHQLVAKMADDFHQSKLSFDYIVAIGSGGYIPARIFKTYLDCPILTVSVSHYDNASHAKTSNEPTIVQWFDPTQHPLFNKNVLLIDEIDDTRATLDFCSRKLLLENPSHLTIAVLHNKEKTKTGTLPDNVHYYCCETIGDDWVVYPWEAKDILAHQNKQS
jgi:hypoxanthine phosphoribosyltransferase